MIHPGRYLANEIKQRKRTQKQFADLLGKKVSEVNELINGKRNITIQRDLLLATVFDHPEHKWIRLQNDYDYYIMKLKLDKKKIDAIKRKKNQLAKQDDFSKF